MPNCDDPYEPNYDESWMHYAVPGKTDSNGIFTPEQCKIFVQNNMTISRGYSVAAFDECSPEMFTSKEDECSRWVFDQSEKTIVEEVSRKMTHL